MKKIELRLQDLEVESFETVPDTNGKKGTVIGFATEQSCQNTCWQTCGETCLCGVTEGETCDFICNPTGVPGLCDPTTDPLAVPPC